MALWTHTPARHYQDDPRHRRIIDATLIIHSLIGLKDVIALCINDNTQMREALHGHNYWVHLDEQVHREIVDYLSVTRTDREDLNFCKVLFGLMDSNQYAEEGNRRCTSYNLYAISNVAGFGSVAGWRRREQCRVLAGIYKQIPTSDLPHAVAKAFNKLEAHMSTQSDNLIAYTPDQKHGDKDRQISLRTGRLLNKLVKEEVVVGLSENMIRDIATYIGAGTLEPKLLLARTECEIAEVYRKGPGSCMSPEKSALECDGTPTIVYASPDTAVGYMEALDGRITARAVLNMVDKRYNTIYGDSVRLRMALQAQGFTEGTLNGCRIAKIKDEYTSHYYMPYINGCGICDHDEDHWICTEHDADHWADSESGYYAA